MKYVDFPVNISFLPFLINRSDWKNVSSIPFGFCILDSSLFNCHNLISSFECGLKKVSFLPSVSVGGTTKRTQLLKTAAWHNHLKPLGVMCIYHCLSRKGSINGQQWVKDMFLFTDCKELLWVTWLFQPSRLRMYNQKNVLYVNGLTLIIELELYCSWTSLRGPAWSEPNHASLDRKLAADQQSHPTRQTLRKGGDVPQVAALDSSSSFERGLIQISKDSQAITKQLKHN